MNTFVPTSPDGVVAVCVRLCTDVPGAVVAAIDGADAARPRQVADRVRIALRAAGRPADIVDLHDFVRPASTRMEYGHTDVESYRTMWFDYAALDREVITALRTDRRWLPRLWNAHTDRSPRDAVRHADDHQVLLVFGPMLLGRGLRFDVSLRLTMSTAALERGTPREDHWTVTALGEHDRSTTEQPDIDVRWDHPDRPAVRTRR